MLRACCRSVTIVPYQTARIDGRVLLAFRHTSTVNVHQPTSTASCAVQIVRLYSSANSDQSSKPTVPTTTTDCSVPPPPLSSLADVPAPTTSHPALETPKSLYARIKGDAQFYWAACKKVVNGFRTSRELLQQVRDHNKQLTARETLLVRQSKSDITRLVPAVLFFGLVPFSSLVLPLVILFVPELLPSAFITRAQKVCYDAQWLVEPMK
jgi:hypothetical protein